MHASTHKELIKTDRQTDKQITSRYTHTDIEIYIQRNRNTEAHTDRHTATHTNTDTQTTRHRQTDKHTDRQTNRHTDERALTFSERFFLSVFFLSCTINVPSMSLTVGSTEFLSAGDFDSPNVSRSFVSCILNSFRLLSAERNANYNHQI